jgi:anti-sigma factor RsiW
MRCEDLTRELASPTGALSPAEVAGHLAACPACAEWSRRARRFDQIWEATRPPGPLMDAMDALWARASRELDALEAPVTLKLATPGRARRRRLAVAAFAFAQAAAILLAALVLFHRDGAGPIEVAVGPPVEVRKPVPLHVTVEDDQLALVQIGDKGRPSQIKTQDLSRLYSSSSIPLYTPHDEVGEMESSDSSPDVGVD